MKCPVITFQSILAALKRQWKFLLIYVLVFSLVSVAVSFGYVNHAAAKSPASADDIPLLDLSEVKIDKNYFENANTQISRYINHLDLVLTMISKESTLSKAQKKAVSMLQETLTALNEMRYVPLQTQFNQETYAHPRAIEELLAYHKDQVVDMERALIESSAAYTLLQTMDFPSTENEAILNSYQTLLNQAALYGQQQQQLHFSQSLLEELSEPETLVARSREMLRDLMKIQRELNSFTDSLNECLSTIATENQLILSVESTDASGFNLSITHTHRDLSANENFTVLSLFCVLVAVCSGMFFVICKDIKRNPVS